MVDLDRKHESACSLLQLTDSLSPVKYFVAILSPTHSRIDTNEKFTNNADGSAPFHEN